MYIPLWIFVYALVFGAGFFFRHVSIRLDGNDEALAFTAIVLTALLICVVLSMICGYHPSILFFG